MIDATRSAIAELGATGEGIMHEEDINTSQNNEFVNKWGECSCLKFEEIFLLVAP